MHYPMLTLHDMPVDLGRGYRKLVPGSERPWGSLDKSRSSRNVLIASLSRYNLSYAPTRELVCSHETIMWICIHICMD